MLSKLAGLLLAGLLSACGKSGGSLSGADGGHCVPFTEGIVTTKLADECTKCSTSNNAMAVDGNLATHATLSINQEGPYASIRATAKNGTVFRPGQMPGAFVSVPKGSEQNNSVTVLTFLGGALQETFKGTNLASHEATFVGFMISKTFDAVEISITNKEATGTPEFGVAEFCSDYVDKRGRHFD